MRYLKTTLNGECMDLREREAVRLRDLLGETPESKAAREARRGAKDAKVKDRDAAKATKKAKADEKRANNAKEKADAKALAKETATTAPRYAVGKWPFGTACGDKTAGGRKCGKKDGCAHRKAYALAEEAEKKKLKTQQEMDSKDAFWDGLRGPKGGLVRCWAG